MDILEAIVLAIIEGLTEFLPVSSTGHMILGSSLMGIQSDDFVKLFTVAIQFGCILSVLVLYWKRFLKSFDFYIKLFLAFIPAAVFGKLLSDLIDQMLESPLTVGISLLAGGILFLFIDRMFEKNELITPEKEEASADSLSYKNALIIGLFQCIAMIPGVSRSGASIIGGLSQGLNRKTAAEFSFFLAVPTMFAATVYKLYSYVNAHSFGGHEIKLLAIGNVIAFIVGVLAIKLFMGVLQKYGFKWFGWYRIILGIIIIALILSGHELQIL